MTFSFICKTITPTFNKTLNLFNNNAELRAPSLKGIVRYWYRATHPNLPDSMLQSEQKHFGSALTNGNSTKSPITLQIRYLNPVNFKKNHPVPGKSFRLSSIGPDSHFEVILRHRIAGKKVDNETVGMFRLALILGGIGQRARRGMGSILILQENNEHVPPIFELDHLKYLLNGAKIHFKEREDNCLSIFQQPQLKFPWLKYIRLGKPVDDLNKLLKNIGHMKKIKKIPDQCLGGISPRFASPVWVKVLTNGKKYRPVYSVFNNPNERCHNFEKMVENYIGGIEK